MLHLVIESQLSLLPLFLVWEWNLASRVVLLVLPLIAKLRLISYVRIKVSGKLVTFFLLVISLEEKLE